MIRRKTIGLKDRRPDGPNLVRRSKLLYWTSHSRAKMRQYGLSESRIKRVIHSPRRVETGIAPETIALMQPTTLVSAKGQGDWHQEIWVMIVEEKGRRKVISAWRYPGKTKPGDPVPSEILQEIRRFL